MIVIYKMKTAPDLASPHTSNIYEVCPTHNYICRTCSRLQRCISPLPEGQYAEILLYHREYLWGQGSLYYLPLPLKFCQDQ